MRIVLIPFATKETTISLGSGLGDPDFAGWLATVRRSEE